VKKVLFVLSFSAVTILTACGGNNGNKGDTAEANSVNTSTTENIEYASIEDATEGDQVESNFGTYNVIASGELSATELSWEGLDTEITNAFLATFTPAEEEQDFFDEEEMQVLVVTYTSENHSNEEMSFHPFSADVTVSSNQHEAAMYLNEGDSDHRAGVIQEQVIPYDLEGADLEEVEEAVIYIPSPSSNSRSIGDEKEVQISF
jgi:hypothetical protein